MAPVPSSSPAAAAAGAADGLPVASFATIALHADDPPDHGRGSVPIAPDLQLSTTYRTPHPDSVAGRAFRDAGEDGLDWQDPAAHIYSRYTSATRARAEKVLSGIMGAHALTYASGLAAAYAVVLHYAPSVIAIRKGYHGVHASIAVYLRSHPNVRLIDIDDDYPADHQSSSSSSSATDSNTGKLLVWIETPLNPTGEARDIAHYASRAHSSGGHLIVDSTFAPLQQPIEHGADMVMHSGTKYFGGHSDLLMGVLAVREKQSWDALWNDRTYVGATPGNLESWLLLRSLRTLEVRWQRQSQTATKLAAWLRSLAVSTTPKEELSKDEADKDLLANGGIVERVWHASFQPRSDKDPSKTAPREVEGGPVFNPKEQLKHGWPACFAFRLSKPEIAFKLPHETQFFASATSLGGVESLLEYRRASDPTEDPALIRLSIGLESFEDLQADLRTAMKKFL